MKIFIICCLLFIHMNMCIFIHGFQIFIRVSGFGYPRVWFWWWIFIWISVWFRFGFRLRISVLGARRLYPIRIRPVDILSPRQQGSGGSCACVAPRARGQALTTLRLAGAGPLRLRSLAFLRVPPASKPTPILRSAPQIWRTADTVTHSRCEIRSYNLLISFLWRSTGWFILV
jgi:hypothetical protein